MRKTKKTDFDEIGKQEITVNYGNVRTVKSKYWFSDGSTETNYHDKDGTNKTTVYSFKKEKKNVRK